MEQSSLPNIEQAILAVANALESKNRYYIGVIPSATTGSTGDKSITGVGFKPRLVKFRVLPGAATTTSSLSGEGAATAAAQYYIAVYCSDTTERKVSTIADCFGVTDGSSSILRATFVSMDDDGFTINIQTAAAYDVAFEAYG